MLFLHGTLSETVYCHQPTGFTDLSRLEHVCRLNKSLYGLKQAPRAWFNRFASHLFSLGFVQSKADSSLFTLSKNTHVAYLLLYVDDIILTSSFDDLLSWIINALHLELSLKDLGHLHHFLGVTITHSTQGMFLSQQQYILDVLDRVGMTDCRPCSMPIDTSAKLPASRGPLLSIP